MHIPAVSSPRSFNGVQPRNKKDLLSVIEQGAQFDYLLFLDYEPLPKGPLTSNCLSQWWPSAFFKDGRVFPTAEHCVMVARAELFGAREVARAVLAASTPYEAKMLGRLACEANDSLWVSRREEIVYEACLAKFSQNCLLASFLLSTKNMVLVEASPVDLISGSGLAEEHPFAADPKAWPGLNILGFALMRVRTQLAATMQLV